MQYRNVCCRELVTEPEPDHDLHPDHDRIVRRRVRRAHDKQAANHKAPGNDVS